MLAQFGEESWRRLGRRQVEDQFGGHEALEKRVTYALDYARSVISLRDDLLAIALTIFPGRLYNTSMDNYSFKILARESALRSQASCRLNKSHFSFCLG